MPKITVSKTRMIAYISTMIKSDKTWACRSLMVIYDNQTPAEQGLRITHDDNKIGFSGVDAEFMSSLAEKYKKYGSLSPTQMIWVHKIMAKYAGQILKKTDKKKLVGLMLRAGQVTEAEHNGFMGDLLVGAL